MSNPRGHYTCALHPECYIDACCPAAIWHPAPESRPTGAPEWRTSGDVQVMLGRVLVHMKPSDEAQRALDGLLDAVAALRPDRPTPAPEPHIGEVIGMLRCHGEGGWAASRLILAYLEQRRTGKEPSEVKGVPLTRVLEQLRAIPGPGDAPPAPTGVQRAEVEALYFESSISFNQKHTGSMGYAKALKDVLALFDRSLSGEEKKP